MVDHVALWLFVGALGLLVLVVVAHLHLPRVRAAYVRLRGRDYGRPMFRPGSCYLITVLRPNGARSPILRRRTAFGYVGQTRQRDYLIRVNQHLHGYRGDPPKWWAGDVVRVRCVYHSRHVTTWGLDFREWLFIKVTFPLHNYRMNLGNPRRVTPPPEVLAALAERKRRNVNARQPRDYSWDELVQRTGDAMQPKFSRPNRTRDGAAGRGRPVGTPRRPGGSHGGNPRR